MAVSKFIESKPEVKAQLLEVNRNLLLEANVIKMNRKINKMKIDVFEKRKARTILK